MSEPEQLFVRKITLLGTGTSQGVPVIGCNCAVCSSDDPRDNRLRAAALLTTPTHSILIDAGPDFRQQMLRAKVRHLDAILLTHEHNDHVIGLDDVRPFNFNSGRPLAVFARQRVIGEVRRRFDYIFGEPMPGLPRLETHPIDESALLSFGDLVVEAVGVLHGRLPILGFKMDNLVYLTDVKTLPESEKEKIRNCNCLIINALHQKKHPTHLNLEEALALIGELAPQRAYLTHISHQMGLRADINAILPPHVQLAYDGLEITF
jgi:phosphoribosyl 1,2-cyclic phosphate phosphodiesterase